jgi:hypothetical protein
LKSHFCHLGPSKQLPKTEKELKLHAKALQNTNIKVRLSLLDDDFTSPLRLSFQNQQKSVLEKLSISLSV